MLPVRDFFFLLFNDLDLDSELSFKPSLAEAVALADVLLPALLLFELDLEPELCADPSFFTTIDLETLVLLEPLFLLTLDLVELLFLVCFDSDFLLSCFLVSRDCLRVVKDTGGLGLRV